MVHLAQIGLGRWGKNLLREFLQVSDVSLICTTGQEGNVKWLQDNYSTIRHTMNMGEILQDSSIEGVVVATPIKTHYLIARQLLEANKHVFLEKPISTTVEEAITLQRLRKKHNKVLLVGYVYVYSEALNKIKELVGKDKIVSMSIQWQKWGSFKEDIRWNLLTHDIAIAISLMGKPKDISTIHEKSVRSPIDIGEWELMFDDGRKCTISINRASHNAMKKVTVQTENTTYLWSDDKVYSLDGRGAFPRLLFTSETSALKHECKDFLTSVQNQTTPLSDDKLATEVTQIVCSLLSR